jgi:hypothetical protein
MLIKLSERFTGSAVTVPLRHHHCRDNEKLRCRGQASLIVEQSDLRGMKRW